MTKNNNLIYVMLQGIYGNRTGMDIEPEKIDALILGYLDTSFMSDNAQIDRTIIPFPDNNELILIYNKYQEEERLNEKKRLCEEESYVLKPLACIPEKNMELYSRCLVCRVDKNGSLKSLKDKDYDEILKYLAE